MKKIFYLILLVTVTQRSLAQQYYHHEYPETAPPAGSFTATRLSPVADGNFCFTTTGFDSLFRVVKINAVTGATRAYGFNGLGSNRLPDSASYYYYPRFFPTRDSGIAVIFTQSNFTFPTSPTDSAQTVIIKLDKNIRVQWAFSRHFATGGTDWFNVSGVTSDNSGNTIMSYSSGNLFGICKISPSGTVLINKQSATQLASKLLSVGTNRYLGLNTTPDYLGGATQYTAYVFNDQLNITSTKSYLCSSDLFDIAGIETSLLSNYDQPLVGGPALQYIPQGGLNFQVMSNSYFVADTSGRLLKFKNIPGIATYSPIADASVGPDNHISIIGDASAPFLAALDTAGNTIYTKDLSGPALYQMNAPITKGTDVFFGALTTNTQGVTLSSDLIKFKNNGTLFCPGAGNTTIPSTVDISFQPITTVIPLLTTTALLLQPSQIDTVPATQLSLQVLCTTTGISEVSEQPVQGTVRYAGNYQAVVSLPNKIMQGALMLRDISGRIILKQEIRANEETVQLQALPSGIYIWQLSYSFDNRQKTDAGRLVIQ